MSLAATCFETALIEPAVVLGDVWKNLEGRTGVFRVEVVRCCTSDRGKKQQGVFEATHSEWRAAVAAKMEVGVKRIEVFRWKQTSVGIVGMVGALEILHGRLRFGCVVTIENGD